MRVLKIIAAVIGALALTYLMLKVAKANAMGGSVPVIQSNNGFTLEMNTVPRALDNTRARLDLKITGLLTESMQPVVRYGGLKTTSSILMPDVVPLVLADSSKGTWFTEFGVGERGSMRQYRIEILDSRENVIASFGMPNGSPFETKARGDVPRFVFIGHLIFMFGTVFFVALAAVFGGEALFRAVSLRVPLLFMLLAGLFTFLGGYPFGFPMNWYAFGTIWEGVPFGTDATDNKTQILFVYFLLVIISGLGTITKNRLGRDVFGKTTLAVMTVLSFLVMLGIYLIPHSIQFSSGTTYAVCYSIISLCALVYLVGYLKSRRARV